jgi:hypothetical protein
LLPFAGGTKGNRAGSILFGPWLRHVQLTTLAAIICLRMKRLNFSRALTISVLFAALLLAGCATIETRISDHPEIYNSLSPRDQALVQSGRIREGMPMGAVWLAWGSPEQKGFGRYHGKSTETWIYRAYYNEYDPYWGGYGYRGFGYPYGFGGGVLVGGRHGRHFVAVYDPFYDPFFYPRFRQVSYPYKTVTFSNGRVVAYQGFTPPYGGY